MASDRNSEKIFSGELLEEGHLVSLADLCRSCTVETETITLLVAEGILDPLGEDIEQ